MWARVLFIVVNVITIVLLVTLVPDDNTETATPDNRVLTQNRASVDSPPDIRDETIKTEIPECLPPYRASRKTENRPKLAVIYTGMIRTFPQCYEQTIGVLSQQADVDVYMSIWDIPGHSYKYWPANADPQKMKKFDFYLTPEDLSSAKLQALFPKVNFKFIDVEPYSLSTTLINDATEVPKHLRYSLSEYYKIQRAFNHIVDDYDWYMRLRCDCTLAHIPNLTQLSDPMIIFNYFMSHHAEVSFSSVSTNEMCWLTNRKRFMTQMCNIVNDLSDMFRTEKAFNPESAVAYFVNQANLRPYVKLCDMNIIVWRAHGWPQTMGKLLHWWKTVDPESSYLDAILS